MDAIDIQDLGKTYPRSWASKPMEAIKGISFVVRQGEAFGFIGANGAGKSTTIKILTGAMRPTRGLVDIFGISSEQPAARKGMGYVPESPSLPDYLTPLEILQGAVKLHKLTLVDSKQHCLDWLDRFQIRSVANKTLRTFSKGMAQRTALAHALCVKPRLLILDEPLSGLDPVGRRDVVDILSEYKKKGGTILLTSHVLHDVERLADRFGLIHQGRLLTVGSPNELVGETQMFTLRSVGPVGLDGMQEDSVGRWSLEVPGHLLWETLERVKGAGHQLLEVRPALTLESAFMRFIEQPAE